MLSRSSAVPFAGMLGRRRRYPRRYCHDIGTGRFAQRGLDQSSREQALDYISTVVRQTLVPATVIVGEEFLVQAQQVQQRCVDIAQVMTLFNGPISDLVGRAENAAGTHPATSKPHECGLGIVITPWFLLVECRLGSVCGAAKFATPDDERFV